MNKNIYLIWLCATKPVSTLSNNVDFLHYNLSLIWSLRSPNMYPLPLQLSLSTLLPIILYFLFHSPFAVSWSSLENCIRCLKENNLSLIFVLWMRSLGWFVRYSVGLFTWMSMVFSGIFCNTRIPKCQYASYLLLKVQLPLSKIVTGNSIACKTLNFVKFKDITIFE